MKFALGKWEFKFNRLCGMKIGLKLSGKMIEGILIRFS
jgi:hypothetical protein